MTNKCSDLHIAIIFEKNNNFYLRKEKLLFVIKNAK